MNLENIEPPAVLEAANTPRKDLEVGHKQADDHKISLGKGEDINFKSAADATEPCRGFFLSSTDGLFFKGRPRTSIEEVLARGKEFQNNANLSQATSDTTTTLE